LDRRIARQLRLKSCSRSDFIRNAIERALTQDGEERLRVAHSTIKWD
jgi:Arc/MetJ-type ribon-helix-helix transcriptional regulator